ncbi:MAG: hypothetical protein ACYC5G_04085 [Candidatus Doudnabacteria bacterium]
MINPPAIGTLIALILSAVVFYFWCEHEAKEYEQNQYNKLKTGLSVTTWINKKFSIGYVVAFDTKTATLVLFDFPHDLVEVKIKDIFIED